MTETVDGVEVASTAVTVSVVSGTQGPQGPQGPAGPTGATGATGPAGAAGQGVPVGGTTGQVLAKTSATDYDTEWVDQTGGGAGSVSSDDITDATVVGKAVLTATDAAAARSAIGAGTSSLALGTTSTTALAGDTAIPNSPDDIGAATTAQGALADTAVQPADLATVATTGAYTDLTGTPTIPDSADDIGAVPTTRTVNSKALSADITLSASDVGAAATTHTHAESDVTGLTSDLAAKAPLASPTFTGTPAAPTATAGTNTTQLATTAFVTTAVAAGGGGGGATELDDLTDVDTTTNAPTDGQALVYDSGSSLWVPGDVSGGGGSSTGRDYRWLVPSGHTTVDEFNDDSLDAAWTRVDSSTSANASWGEGADSLVYHQTVGDSSSTGAGHGLMRALSGAGGSLATGDGFVACITYNIPTANYASFGVMLADGATSGSGNQLWGGMGYDTGTGFSSNLQPFTNYSNAGSNASNRVVFSPLNSPLWLRLAKVGSTSFRLDISPNGAVWTPAVTAVTNSTTFTHVGFFGCTFAGGATRQMNMVDTIRRVSGVS